MYLGRHMAKTDSKERLEFFIRSTIFDRSRRLVIDPEYLEFDDKDRIGDPPTQFKKSEIEGLRYGVEAIRGYRFRIGRTHCIDVRDVSGAVIKIRLKSVYRIRRKLLEEKYLAVATALLRYYFHDMTREYIRQFRAGQTIELLGVNLDRDGLLFDETVGRVSWDFIGSKRYWHYYTLYSLEDPDKYRAFITGKEWNAVILRGVIDTILKEKFPDRLTS